MENKALQPHNELLTNLNLIGNLAILVDAEFMLHNFQAVLDVLKMKQIKFKLIKLEHYGLNLLNPKIWKNINRVLILIANQHQLSQSHLQAILEILNLDYTGNDILSTLLTKDIIKSKKIWQRMGINTPPYIKWQANLNWQEMLGLIGLPIAIKSLNSNNPKLFKINHIDKFPKITEKFNAMDEILIEPWITGDKYVIYIINQEPLMPIKVNNVSQKDETPHDLNKIKNLQNLGKAAFKAIGGQGFAEIFILEDINGDCWILSINTNLGLNLHPNSTLMVAANKTGINFATLIEQILATSFNKKSYLIHDKQKII